MKRFLFLLVIIVVIINLPPLKFLFGQEDLLYSNENGSFTFDEANYAGRDFELCLDNFQAFKSMHNKDTVLFRITPLSIFSFWRWSDYLLKKKYKLPYRSWDEIEALRGPMNNKTNWQAF